MCIHLFTNATLMISDKFFQHEINFIHSIPALLFIEISLWSAIAFHAILGVYYVLSGNRSNAQRYGYASNIRYTLQRATAWPTLIFIFIHIATLRWRWTFGGIIDTPSLAVDAAGNPLAAATTAYALQYSYWILALYIIGITAAVYHFANGLWTAAITWGATVTVASQKRWGLACAGLFVVLIFFSATGIAASLNYEHNLTPEKIKQLREEYKTHDHSDHSGKSGQHPKTDETNKPEHKDDGHKH